MRNGKRQQRGRSRVRTAPVLRARRFELVDDRGRVRAVLGDVRGDFESSGWGLELYDDAGSARLVVLLAPWGPLISIAAAGNAVLELGHSDPGTDVSGCWSFLQFMDAGGSCSASIRVDASGAVEVLGIT
jgi:hypothetical protein